MGVHLKSSSKWVRTERLSLLLPLAQSPIRGIMQHSKMFKRIDANLKSSRWHQTPPPLADDSGIKCSQSPELPTEACYWGVQLHPYSSIMIMAVWMRGTAGLYWHSESFCVPLLICRQDLPQLSPAWSLLNDVLHSIIIPLFLPSDF